MPLSTVDYWRKYHQLRLNAKEWNIDYTRYTHAQLQYAMELNDGKINSMLRTHLNILPPTNAFYMAKAPKLAESHNGQAVPQDDLKPSPLPPFERKPDPKPVKTPQAPHANISFSVPAPKEASVWSRLPTL